MKTCLGRIVARPSQADPAFPVENHQRWHSMQPEAVKHFPVVVERQRNIDMTPFNECPKTLGRIVPEFASGDHKFDIAIVLQLRLYRC